MLAGWPTMTATCWTPRQIGSPTWVQWHLPPTRRPRQRTNTRASGHRGKEVASSARAHAAGQPGRNPDTGSRCRGPAAAHQRPRTRDRDAGRGRLVQP